MKRVFLGERFAKLPVLFQLDETLNVTDLIYDMDDERDLPTKLTKNVARRPVCLGRYLRPHRGIRRA